MADEAHKDLTVVTGTLADRFLVADESDSYASKNVIGVPALTADQLAASATGVPALNAGGDLLDAAGDPILTAAEAAAVRGLVSKAWGGFPLSPGALLINGDSMQARNFNEFQPTGAASRAGSVGLIPLAGHLMPAGTEFTVAGYTDARWNGRKTLLPSSFGTTANVVAFAIDPSADAAPVQGGYAVGLTIRGARNAAGIYNWCEWLSGLDFNLAMSPSLARGGRTFPQMDADFDVDRAAYQGPSVILMFGGTNDPKNSVPTAQSIASLESLVVKSIAYGDKVILSTVPPLAGAAYTTAVRAATFALNRRIYSLGAQYQCPVLDLHGLSIDPFTANIQAIYVDTDNIHVNPRFWRDVAPTLIDILKQQGLSGALIQIPFSAGDTVGVNAGSTNLINGFFSGTGGTLAGAGLTGVVADGWTLVNNGIANLVASKGTPSPAVGSSQVMTFNASTGNCVLQMPSIHSSLTAGMKIKTYAKVKVTAMARPFRMSSGILLTIDGVASQLRMTNTYGPSLAFPAGSYTMILQSDEWVIPSGVSITVAQPFVQPVLTGAAETGSIEVSQFAVRNLS